MQNFLQLMKDGIQHKYVSSGGIQISRTKKVVDGTKQLNHILEKVDEYRGALFSSRYEYPGRYSRWDVGFIHPPIVIRAKEKSFTVEALNKRGFVLLPPIFEQLKKQNDLSALSMEESVIKGLVSDSTGVFAEEERSQQPSIFTVIREIKSLFASEEDSFLGLYGAFGYDLVFQFEPIEQKLERYDHQSDIVLYLPDEIIVVDHQATKAYQLSYEFQYEHLCTNDKERIGDKSRGQRNRAQPSEEYRPGHYASLVHKAKAAFKSGDMFEVVPSQTIYETCHSKPSEVFNRLQKINPSPYGFIINLGEEFLVGSSPEMYVRVEGKRVETCPISGTIKRGSNALEDADQIRKLLNSKKMKKN